MPEIFTSILVPAITNGPSLTNLQWSEDGQAFVVTRSAIYILTPKTGIDFEPSTVIKSLLAQTNDNNVKIEPLSWYRTMIEFEKAANHNWPLESHEWGTVSLGSLDISWCSITLSPSNLSQGSGCVLAALNTNLEVSLWMASKNYLTEEWIKIQDVTETLKESEPVASGPVRRALSAQVHSISWSQQIDLGEGTHYVDGSLLALGNRAGRVVFMQFSSQSGQGLRHITTIDVSDDWVHHLAWSVWRRLTSDCFHAYLACGVPDGGIIIISVSLNLVHTSNEFMGTRFSFELQEGGLSCCPCGSAITALTWINSGQHAPILAYAKPGVVHLQTFPSECPLGWTGNCVLPLQLQPLSSSSTPFAAASGFLYYEQDDTLLVCLYDGSFHLIHGISTYPSIYPLDKMPSSEEITHRARGIFAISEGTISFDDANRISGACNYDSEGTVLWLHEKCNPHDFDFKQDSKQNSMFIVARLWKKDIHFFERLRSEVTKAHYFDVSPAHALRGMLLHLRDGNFLKSHQGFMLDLLKQLYTMGEASSEPSAQPSSRLDENERLSFRCRLFTDLFRRRCVYSLRLGYVLSTFCSSVSGRASSPFDIMVKEFSNAVLRLHLRTVILQIDRVSNQLEESDRGFVRRWVAQSLTQDSPLLRDEAVALANKVRIPLESMDVGELCPACHAVVPSENSDIATCPNGHIWVRCSITSILLATPCVRTCVGCCRKARLPPSMATSSLKDGPAELSPHCNSWVVHELLEAARWCIFCGNRFVRVL